MSLADLPGGRQFCDWFGDKPTFQDAVLTEFELRPAGTSLLRARTFRVHPEADAEGFFVQSKHVLVTFAMTGLSEVNLVEIKEAGVMSRLAVKTVKEGIELSFGAAYGVRGWIVARQIAVAFEPQDLL